MIRVVRLNLAMYDLDRIYDSIHPTTNHVEFVQMNGKPIKHCHFMSSRNMDIMESKLENRDEYFVNCIGISFPGWGIRFFRNGSIVCVNCPNNADYNKGMEMLFDILKNCGYTPYLI